ncbi:MAG: hypothetical protein GX851_05885, partial [Clostridiales bacterium]|nr:hypothetical protein [Clostridiales bacterium]
VDFPLAAQQLQMQLYGQTNIELEPNRVTAIDLIGGYVRASTTIAPVPTTNPEEDVPVSDETTTAAADETTATTDAQQVTTTAPVTTTTTIAASSAEA